jgi:hypothetical protein
MAERVFYRENGIRISSARATFFGQTYPVNGMTSVSGNRHKSESLRAKPAHGGKHSCFRLLRMLRNFPDRSVEGQDGA